MESLQFPFYILTLKIFQEGHLPSITLEMFLQQVTYQCLATLHTETTNFMMQFEINFS
jgi:hypothetical protein